MVYKIQDKWEYGDFQTPIELAEQTMSVIRDFQIQPKSIVEPTCGKGSFLLAATRIFPNAERFIGVDINGQYLNEIRTNITNLSLNDRIHLISGDFFLLDWTTILDKLPEPILIIGNPPWVTNSKLGMLNSTNIPDKSNFQGRRGYDAITGKSNFDISEWMLLRHLDWLTKRQGVIGMLCKTSVARKVLFHAWSQKLPL
jgi:type I restriction-modification system DNA methylase subunit